MLFETPLPETDKLRAAIRAAHRMDETASVEALIVEAALPVDANERVSLRAEELIAAVREERIRSSGIDAFLHEYELSSREGVVLMCLAEALLRIPDADTRDRLIRDKIGGADWERHMGMSDSLFVNASTWALMLTGRLLHEDEAPDLTAALRQLIATSGEPVIRQAMTQAMRIMGRQFVMGRTIDEALDRAAENEARGYRHSFDMLGEAACTMADAKRYFEAYANAIADIGKAAVGRGPVEGPGISVKLSALHPRYELGQRDRALDELAPDLKTLALMAKKADIGFTVDAEEADRLDISLDVIEAVFADPDLDGWNGFGLAVQGYLKSGPAAIDWLADLARRVGRPLMLRLVKGAYWDAEIKQAQEDGLEGYPVFTRKASTDVSYLACAKRIAAAGDVFYPRFATHNAHTLAAVGEILGDRRDFEYQRLHGMGEALYDRVVGADGPACRIYAPVGSHKDLLAYLVRRLLENGSNTSFVNRIVDEELPISAIAADPVAKTEARKVKPHPRIPLPRDMHLPERANSKGIDLNDPATLAWLDAEMDRHAAKHRRAAPIIDGEARDGEAREARDPADDRRVIGEVVEATADQVETAIAIARGAAPGWDLAGAGRRATALERAADLFEANMAQLMTIAVREGGKTIADAVAEVREAVDFLRYYAARARADFAGPLQMPGPTGETNELELHGRGVFACISPWNFPLAIFTGQVSAALAAGNAVIAKPAGPTPLIAHRAVELMHDGGVPGDVLHLLPGPGGMIGGALASDQRIAGIAFTGSTETAQGINRALAARAGAIVPLIAETGGQNAMIVDSSALPEQVVGDAVTSAFQSAGQRCSALRVLYLQDEIADRVIEMLAGAMAELKVGAPGLLATDVGPVIDEPSRATLAEHAGRMDREARPIATAPLAEDCGHGTYLAPRAYEIDSIDILKHEVFGPILHVVRFAGDRLDQVVDAINGTGYGLTLGIHSRIDSTVERIHRRLKVGNTYVNRNQIGAVVGVQPFGGEGLSGTGPKAGGPRYLYRFATERVLTVDTTAAGGNTALLSLDPEDEG
ncbi:MAG: bifunctional proline dehydrogenase/L-glutamate gamma-semialdehyde dehydrogenase PutA [Alphaproteobacteria bacterium]|jgi:RHH-type proline utilization regulon transcriptional repressor/proline dehydrogenase/delta 1-pyrroline-5-carboxylate dehydrogenase|nr:bifunctional proline dehydrogenase/L-glutamate gamma-semialdehyde dehydrogenase PutA [Alphaproteobacteria bacterium]